MTYLFLTFVIFIQDIDINGKWESIGSGISSGYRPWRKSKFVPYARYPGKWSVKPTPRDLVCAHRTLAFGSILRLHHKGRVGYCVVLDRGPYGFCEHMGDRKKRPGCKRGHRYFIKKRVRERRRGYYRGIIDASIAVHQMMDSRGWIWTKVERLKGVRIKKVLRQSKKLADRRSMEIMFPAAITSIQ